MSWQLGHVMGRLHTLALHLEQVYPPVVRIPWHAHMVGVSSITRDGKPIIMSAAAVSAAVACVARTTGGVVVASRSSRNSS